MEETSRRLVLRGAILSMTGIGGCIGSNTTSAPEGNECHVTLQLSNSQNTTTKFNILLYKQTNKKPYKSKEISVEAQSSVTRDNLVPSDTNRIIVRSNSKEKSITLNPPNTLEISMTTKETLKITKGAGPFGGGQC
ncbi:MAG: hypothetical protein ABEJ42_05490 [Halobacteriaceae archaeon]